MFHRLFKHIQFRRKYSAARTIFNLIDFWVLGYIPMKHCLLCLIYEMKHCAPITVTFLSLTVKSIFVIIYIAGNSYPFGRISSGLG